jgi:hypothetical protein
MLGRTLDKVCIKTVITEQNNPSGLVDVSDDAHKTVQY